MTGPAIALLAGHDIIAWDFDETLVGHVASQGLHEFIAAHPDRSHVIVTFRMRSTEAQLWADLAAATDLIGRQHFNGIAMMEDRLAEAAQRLGRNRRQGLFAGPLAPAERDWKLWKGEACLLLGASVLVDDRHADVAEGCARHGIALLHPDQFVDQPKVAG